MTTRARIPRLIFFGLLALITFSELLFSNLGTLNGDIKGIANMLGLTVDQERMRLLILIVLDAIAGTGAVLAVVGLMQRNALLRAGAQICAAGFGAYGLYQFFAAFTQLSSAMRAPVAGAGLVYLLVGVLVWVVGRRS